MKTNFVEKFSVTCPGLLIECTNSDGGMTAAGFAVATLLFLASSLRRARRPPARSSRSLERGRTCATCAGRRGTLTRCSMIADS